MIDRPEHTGGQIDCCKPIGTANRETATMTGWGGVKGQLSSMEMLAKRSWRANSEWEKSGLQHPLGDEDGITEKGGVRQQRNTQRWEPRVEQLGRRPLQQHITRLSPPLDVATRWWRHKTLARPHELGKMKSRKRAQRSSGNCFVREGSLSPLHSTAAPAQAPNNCNNNRIGDDPCRRLYVTPYAGVF